jgi:hypothetical protein
MQPGPDQSAIWISEAYRLRKFGLHGARLRVRTVDAYDESARDTIRGGVRVSYTDHGEDRVGYFDAHRRRFTVLSGDEILIVNHFHATANYVRHLDNSDYL